MDPDEGVVLHDLISAMSRARQQEDEQEGQDRKCEPSLQKGTSQKRNGSETLFVLTIPNLPWIASVAFKAAKSGEAFWTRMISSLILNLTFILLSKLLGHKDIKVTQRYAHHCPDSLRGGVEVLDNYHTLSHPNEKGLAISS
jgi:hypothetical protein